MNQPDPRWLEILKASGWQTSALTVACLVVLALVKAGLIPTDGSPYWTAIPTIGAVVFGFLSLAAMAKTIVRVIGLRERFSGWRRRRLERRSVLGYIPYMTDREKEIIGYLLHHNQKVFQTDEDGGYAAPLISRGIVRRSGVPGQVIDVRRVPFEIPDHVWAVLESHRNAFPCNGPDREGATPPWVIPWMAR